MSHVRTFKCPKCNLPVSNKPGHAGYHGGTHAVMHGIRHPNPLAQLIGLGGIAIQYLKNRSFRCRSCGHVFMA